MKFSSAANLVHLHTYMYAIKNPEAYFRRLVNNQQTRGIELRASDFSCQCSTTWAMATKRKSAFEIVNITLYMLSES